MAAGSGVDDVENYGRIIQVIMALNNRLTLMTENSKLRKLTNQGAASSFKSKVQPKGGRNVKLALTTSDWLTNKSHDLEDQSQAANLDKDTSLW